MELIGQELAARDVAAIDSDIDAMEAEYEQATEAEKAKLQHEEKDAYGARDYLRRMSAQVESALPAGGVKTQVATEEAATAILAAALQFDVYCIVMPTRGHAGLARARCPAVRLPPRWSARTGR